MKIDRTVFRMSLRRTLLAWVVLCFAAATAHAGALTKTPASMVSGLAPSATTDATNAGNITTGVLPAAQLPAPTTTTRGGAIDATAAANQVQTGSVSGTPQFSVLGTIQATVGTVARSIASFLGENMTARDYGASCAGVLDDTTAINLMATTLGRVVVPQNCILRLATATAFSVPVTVAPGGSVKVDGVTAAFNGYFDAKPIQVFTLANGGVVTLAPSQAAYPEWWYNSGDWLPALNAATTSGALSVVLGCKDYTTSSTWTINVNFINVGGCRGQRVFTAGQGTRINVASGTADVVQLGPSTQPSSINNFATGMIIHDFGVTRSVIPAALAVGSEYASNAGIRAQYMLSSVLRNTASLDSSNAYALTGQVQSHWDDNYADRTIAGSNTSNDFWRGFNINGLVVTPGVAGANASLYMRRNVVGYEGGATGQTIGFYANGSSVDTFIDEPETSNTSIGMLLLGTYVTGATYSPTYMAAQDDVRINRWTFDGCSDTCFLLQNINEFAQVDIRAGYAGLAAGGNFGVHIINSYGLVSLTDNQAPGWQATNRTSSGPVGFLFETSKGIYSSGNKINGMPRPEIISGIGASIFSDNITNPTGSTTAAGYAVSVANSTGLKVAPIINGGASIFGAAAIAVSGGSGNEFDTTAIDRGVATSVLTYGGTAQTTAFTAFGTKNVIVGVPN